MKPNNFYVDEKVEWTDINDTIHTGTIVEYSYDIMQMSNKYLIKLSTGQYITKWEYELRRVENGR